MSGLQGVGEILKKLLIH